MFVIIPLIIIAFCITYLKLSTDISIFSYIIVYGIIALTIIGSYKIYKSFKDDLKVQDDNAVKMQINELLQKINISEDEAIKHNLQEKVNQLKKELK